MKNNFVRYLSPAATRQPLLSGEGFTFMRTRASLSVSKIYTLSHGDAFA
jgi:hypothetical protein